MSESPTHSADPRRALSHPARLAALDAYAILDTPPEQGFDDIVQLARQVCGAPVALVSLVDRDRQWFKAREGFPHCETDLNSSVCAHALAEPDLLVIPNLATDPRTRDNPLVMGPPYIQFYAGAPLRTPEGHALGSLCVIDHRPRPEGLSEARREALRMLARQVVTQLELRRALTERDIAVTAERHGQAQAVADAQRLEAMIATQQIVASATADLDAIFQAIVDGALRVVDAAAGAVVEMREGDELVYRTASGSSAGHLGFRMPLTDTLSGLALRDERPVFCADTEADAAVDYALVRELGIRSMIAVPVQRHGTAVGVLKLQSDRPNAFAPRDLLLAQMLAGLTASAFGEVAEAQTRQALREAESRYKAIFDSAIDFAIVAADPHGRITDWNEGAERIMGWSAGEVRGQSLDVFFTPEDRAAGQAQHEERTALAVGSASDVRWHQRKDGERFYALGRMMPLRHEDESVRGYLKILQDRTREKRREERLSIIGRASAALLDAPDPADALLPIVEGGAEALGFEQSFTYELAADGCHLDLTHSVGVGAAARERLMRLPLDVPLCGLVVQTGRPVVLAGVQSSTEPRHALARASGINAYAGFPIVERGRIVGAISFASGTEPAFDDDAVGFFATLARFLSLARGRRAAEAALRASETSLRTVLDTVPVGIMFAEAPSGRIVGGNGRVADILRHPIRHSADAESYGEWVAFHADGRPVAPAEYPLSRILREGLDHAELECEYLCGDGIRRWIAIVGAPMRDASEAVIGAVVAVSDIDERRRAEARQDLLNHELSHRMKNLLAMVQSIATQTMRNAADVGQARDVLGGRLIALGKAHDLLMGGALTSTRLEAVVRGALQLHEDRASRFRIAGPDLGIGADQALSLSLSLHELATNAAKYGALSNAAGRVAVTWAILDPGDEEVEGPRLRLSWEESEGPPVSPPTRKGFGSRFVQRALATQVGGDLVLAYPETGVTCTLTAPLAAFESATLS